MRRLTLAVALCVTGVQTANAHQGDRVLLISELTDADLPYADAGGGNFSEQPAVAVTEAYVTVFDHISPTTPSESLRSNLLAGRVIGLALKVTDADVAFNTSSPTRTSYPTGGGSTGSLANWQEGRRTKSSFFGDALLLPAHGCERCIR